MSKTWSARTRRRVTRSVAGIIVPLLVMTGLTTAAEAAVVAPAAQPAAAGSVSKLANGQLMIDAPGSPFQQIYSDPTRANFQAISADYGQVAYVGSTGYGNTAGVSTVSAGTSSSLVSSSTSLTTTYNKTRTASLDKLGGTGSLANPWFIESGFTNTNNVTVTQRYSYSAGTSLVRVDTTAKNSSASALPANTQITTGVDCFFSGSDTGPTYFQGDTVQCAKTTSPSDPRMSFVPVQAPTTKIGGDGSATFASTSFGGNGSLGTSTNFTGYFKPVSGRCYQYEGAVRPPFSSQSCASSLDNGMAMGWTVGAINPGASVTRTYYMSYDANLTFADLQPTVSVAPATVNLGQEATYTVSVKNASTTSAVTEVQAAYLLPAGMTFVSSSAGAAYDATTGTWSVGTIAANGTATMTVTGRATTAGTKTSAVQAAMFRGVDNTTCGPDGGEANCGSSATLTVLRPAVASTSTIAATPSTRPADGASTSTVTVTLRDPLGAAITTPTTNTVAITSNLVGSTVGPVTNNGNGTYSATVRSTAPGAATLSFAVDGKAGTGTAAVSFTSLPATTASSSFEVSEGAKAADGTDAHALTVRLGTSLGGAVSGAAAQLGATSSPAAGVTIGSFTEVAGTPGTYTAPITSTVAGAKTISPTLNGASIATLSTPGRSTATFVAGPPTTQDGKSSLTLSAGPKTADGVQQHQATVVLKDAADNPVTGAAALLSLASSPGAGVVLGGFVEGLPGVYTAPVTSTVAGVTTITASYAATVTIGSGDVSFVPGAVDHTVTALTATTGTQVAGVGEHTASVVVKDAQGNPVSGVPVDFTSTATLSPATPVLTDAAGLAQTTITSQTAGDVQVSATAAGSDVADSPTTVSFVAGEPAFGDDGTSIASSTGPVLADDVATHTATVTVLDQLGNPVSGAEVVFSPAPELISKSATTVTTGDDGTAVLSVASTTAGAFGITATVDGHDVVVGSPASVEFAAGAPSAGSSSWTVSSGPVTADGEQSYTATVTLLDANSNPAPAGSVTFDTGSHVSIAETGPYTVDAEGRVVVTLTSTVAGTHEVSASVGGTQIGDPASLVFVADAPALGEGKTRLSATTATKIADGAETQTVTATVVDAHDNPVAGAAVVFTVPSELTALTPTTTTTNAEGLATVELSSETAGSFSVTAQVGDAAVTNGSPATVSFVAGEVAVGSSTFAVTPSGPVVADGTAAYTAAVTLTDSNGNPVQGETVTFDYPTSLTGDVTAVSGADGVASVEIASTLAGSFPVSAFVGDSPVGETSSMAFVAGSPSFGTGATSISATSDNRAADGAQRHTATVVVRDAHGNPVRDAAVELTVAGPATAATATSVTTDSLGEATVDITSTTAGTFDVDATVGGSPVTEGAPAQVTFVAGAAAAGSSTFAVSAGPVVADGVATYTATVTVKDAHGNLVDGQDVTFEAGTEVSGPRSAVTVAGVASVELVATTAGTYPLTASLGGDQVGEAASLVFTAGPASVGDSTFSTSEGAVEADGTSQHYAQVVVRDAHGNVVPDVEVDFTVQDGATGSGTVTTDSAGVARALISSSEAATYTVSAAIGADTVGSGSVTFTAGAPSADSSSWTVVPDTSLTVGGTEHFTATVTLRDATGNPVPGETVGFDLPEGVTADREGPYVTGADGTVSIDLTSDAAGTSTIAALLGAAEIGAPVEITFVSAATSTTTSTIAVDKTVAEANGVDAFGVVVTLRDAFGNIVTDAGDVVTLTSTRGSVGAAAQQPDGTYVGTVTSDSAGVSTLGFAVGALDGAATVPVTFVATPTQPVIHPSDGVSVTGTAQAGSTVTVTDADGVVVGSAVAGIDGAFTIVLTDVAGHEDLLTVTSTDTHGFVSGGVEIEVDAEAPTAPVVLPSNGSVVSGSAEAGSVVTIYGSDGAAVGTVVVGADGTFAHTFDPVLADGASVRVTATDPAGNESAGAPLTIDGSAVSAPTVEDSAGLVFTGTGAAGNTITVTLPGDVVLTVEVGVDGTWTVDAPESAALVEGDVVTVVQSNPAGTSSAPVQVTIDQTVPEPAVVDPSDGSTVTGAIEVGSTITVTDGAGQPVEGELVVNPDGTFVFVPTVPFTEESVVSITVVDPAGNSSEPVTVEVDTTVPGAAVVDPSDGSTVTGSVEAGSTITITDGAGQPIPGELVVEEDGSFVFVPTVPFTEESVVSITVVDPAGNPSEPVTVEVDTTTPAPAVVDPSDGSTVMGSVEAGATITVTDGDGQPVEGELTVNPDGTFVFTPTVPFTEESVVSITVVDPAGNPSPSVTVEVDTTIPAPAVVNPSDGRTVTGSVEPGATVEVIDGAGQPVQGELTVNPDGTFVFTPTVPFTEESVVSITVVDPAGNSSEPVTVEVDTTPPGAAVVNPSDGSTVTGSIEPGATITVTDGAGQPVEGELVVEEDGSFVFTPTVPFTEESVVSITVVDPAGNPSEPVTVEVDTTNPAPAVVNPSDGSTVSGAVEAGSTITVTDGAGQPVEGELTVNPDGTFVFVPTVPFTEESVVSITVVDPAGNPSEPVTVEVDTIAPVAPTVFPSNGSVVAGSAEAGSTVVVYGADGEVLVTIVVGDDGAFAHTFDPVLADGSSVSVTATDPAGNESAPAALTIDGSAVVAPTIAGSDGSVFSGTGTPGNTITVTLPRDVTLTTVVGVDGTWTVTPQARTITFDGEVVTARQTNPAGTVSPPAQIEIDQTAPSGTEIDLSDGETVTGTVEPGATVTVVDGEGNPVPGEVVVTPDGSFVFTPTTPLDEETPVFIVVTDASGNSAPPVVIPVDTTAPVGAEVDPSDGKAVTGSVEPGTTVTVVDGAGNEVPGRAVVTPDGTFTFTPDVPFTDASPVFVVVTDPAGNASAPVTIPVDTTAPTAPVVDPSNGQKVTGGVIEAGDTVTVTDSAGTPVPGTIAVDDQGRFTFVPDTPFTDGDTIVVVVTDGVGNTVTVSTTVDTAKPKPPVMDPTDGGTVTGCAEPGSTVVVRDKDGTVIGSAVAGPDCSFEVLLEPRQDEGETITIDVVDPAGNVSERVTVRVGSLWMLLQDGVLVPGEKQVAYGYGFQPGEEVSAVMHSDPVDMGTQVADEDGEVTFEVTIPADVALGSHQIVLAGAFSGEIAADFTVEAAPVATTAPAGAPGGLSQTGADVSTYLSAGALLVLLGGGVLVAVRRRRDTQGRAAV